MYEILKRGSERLAVVLALTGGLVFIALIALTCVSIIGRALLPLDLGIGPIRGIYDITEIGMAAAIFAFLPWAMFTDAHARVDLFKPAMPAGVNHGLDLTFDLAMLIAAATGTYRLYLGLLDKLSNGETTIIAGIPVWQGYALSLVGGIGFVLVALFCVLRSARRLLGLTI